MGLLGQGSCSGCSPLCWNQNSFADSSPCLLPCPQAALGFKLGVVSSGNSLDYTDKCLELMSSNQVRFWVDGGLGRVEWGQNGTAMWCPGHSDECRELTSSNWLWIQLVRFK